MTVEQMCRETGLSRAGFYRHWHKRSPSQEETELRERMQTLALAQRSYGYRRITALLRREGLLVNHKRVLRLLREDNLLAVRKKRFVTTTDSRHRWSSGTGRCERFRFSARGSDGFAIRAYFAAGGSDCWKLADGRPKAPGGSV